MPLPKGTRYRYRKIEGGQQRIAFKNDRVLEVKTIKNESSIIRIPSYQKIKRK